MAVSRDATSGWYVPASSAEWAELLTGTGLANPSNLWLCQEASGGLAASIGATVLVAAGAKSYLQAVTGWTRTSTNIADGAASNNFNTTTIHNSSTTSGMLLMYARLTGVPAAERAMAGFGGSTSYRYLAVTTGPRFKAHGLGGQATVTGTVDPGTDVHPIIIKVDRSRSEYRIYTDDETLAPAWTNPGASNTLLSLGTSIGGGAAPAGYLYAAFFSGAAAELSDEQVATLLGLLQNGPASGSTIARNRLVNDGRMGPMTKGSVT